MSATKQPRQAKTTSRQPGPSGKAFLRVALALAVLVPIAAFVLLDSGPPTASPTRPEAASPPGSENAEVAKPHLGFLEGRWYRPDGGYVIELREDQAAGRWQAAYYNPQSINVSQVQVFKDGPATKVLIELQDVNYPGCKYDLTYIPQEDLLAGSYYQAALDQTYDVQFVRMK
ncbi:MAG: hypothetical protein FJ387_00460 [Verrucomicrobia bacterium]|nr:hypothetical protein [Verrucomicrobiota bacterium]